MTSGERPPRSYGWIAGGIPADALEHHVAIVGKTGAGKTYTARLVIEELLELRRRICIVDPTGVWYGLRLTADGKPVRPAAAIVGGDHQDAPLEHVAGERHGELVGKHQGAIIFDVSHLTVGQRTRWFADFADSLFRHNREPLHLVIDEAHLFVPQGRVANPQSAQMLHAGNHLVSGGRARGLRIVLISQRPAKVHKDALTQVETLIAMRLIAPQDRKAIRDWIQDCADPDTGRRILGELPSLPNGSGYVWSPEQDYLELVAFPLIRTRDTMKAPEPGEALAELPPLDPQVLAELALEARAPGENRSQASRKPGPDPDELRELRSQLAAVGRRRDELEAAIERAAAGIRQAMQRAHDQVEEELARLAAVAQLPQDPAPPAPGPIPAPAPRVSSTGAEDPLVEAARRLWPARLTWSQLCATVGRKARGGHFNRTKKALLDAGVVRESADSPPRVELTDPPDGAGEASAAVLLEQNLPEPARKMFREIRAAGWCTRDELADRLDMTPRGGHWNRGLAILRGSDLVLEQDGRLQVNPELVR